MDEARQEPADDDRQWDDWLRRLIDGEDQAVADFWRQYGPRLQGLAAGRLNIHLQRRVDPEDVVQSACRTFLRRLHAGDFELTDSESLWRLLCVITLAKARKQVRYHRQAKRSIDRERSLEGGDDERGPQWDAAARSPGPEEAVAFADQFEQLLAGLDAEERQVVHLKLDERTHEEIAREMKCSERTVRRMLNRVRSRLQALLAAERTSPGQ